MPLRPTADRFDGCFCLGSGPVFGVSWCCFAFALFPLAKRKSGWGICGSSLFVWLWFSLFVLIDLLISRTYVLVQCFSCLLSCKDRALVRHRPISRNKKKWLGFILSVGPEVFVSTFILKYEKNDSKLAPILGAGKRLPKWESAPLLLQK